MPEEPRDRLPAVPKVFERIGAIEGVAVLLLVAVALVVFGLATHTVWPVVVGGVLLVFTVADAVILSWVRRRR
jgi:protein-S-isoprenylcysteine O-methyltransferase Ste14